MFTHLDDPDPPSPTPVKAMQVTATGARRRRRRHRLIGSAVVALAVIGAATALPRLLDETDQQVMSGEGSTTSGSAPSTTRRTSTTTTASEPPPDTVAPTETTTTGSPPPTAPADPDRAAAAAFIDAWRHSDVEAMRQLAPDDQVEVAQSFGAPDGDPECTNGAGGQYQCSVTVSSGTRLYILVGEPGDETGRVWWVSVDDGH